MTTTVALRGGAWRRSGLVMRWTPVPPPRPKMGRPLKPVTLSPEEQRRGRRMYIHGDRGEFARLANREYQRVARRREREAAAIARTDRRHAEDALWTDLEARRARNAYNQGDRSVWAVGGNRAYFRRAKRNQKRRNQPRKEAA